MSLELGEDSDILRCLVYRDSKKKIKREDFKEGLQGDLDFYRERERWVENQLRNSEYVGKLEIELRRIKQDAPKGLIGAITGRFFK